MMAQGGGKHSTKFDLQSKLEGFTPLCDDVSKYEKMTKIGQGTFGEVFKGRNPKTGELVALKKVLMENETEGFPITALREIKILQRVKHKNIVNLIEVCGTKPTVFNRFKATFYMVFEFCEHDLAGLLSNINVKFSLGEIKMVIKQILDGLFYVHIRKILHRDMKSANILVTRQGVVKLADFGLATSITERESDRYTNRVCTLWYRPPELLLGERKYGTPVDMWGVGCIMAEMWTRTPILQGNAENHQLTLICNLCGSITPEAWPGVEKYELFKKIELPKGQRRRVKERLQVYVKDPSALDLLDRLLTLDPRKRIQAKDAADHEFIWNGEVFCSLEKMLSRHSHSMFEYTMRKAHAYQKPNQPHLSKISDDQLYDRVF